MLLFGYLCTFIKILHIALAVNLEIRRAIGRL